MTHVTVAVTHPHVAILVGVKTVNGRRTRELHARPRLGDGERLDKVWRLPVHHGCWKRDEVI